MNNLVLLSEINGKLSKLKKFKRKVVQHIITNECLFQKGDRVLVKDKSDVAIMVGVIASISLSFNSVSDYSFSYTIQRLDPLYGNKTRQRLKFDNNSMSLIKIKQ